MVAHQFGLDRLLGRGSHIPEYTALDDVSFTLRHGERIGLIGRNGAGKTTLLKMITRAIAPSSGEIEVNGSVQALMATGIGFHPEFTGRQNIDATLKYYGLYGPDYEAAMADVIRFVELGKYIDQPFSTYSLGMQARTQFAVATVFRPDVLLIDEVLGAGDGYFAAKSADRMKGLINSGCSLIMVSHSSDLISQFCERVIWLRDGRIHRDGDADDVLAEYEQEMTNLSQAGAGTRVASVVTSDPFRLPESLQTAFVDLHVREAEPVADFLSRCESVRLADGRSIRRIVGKMGPRISGVAMERLTASTDGGLSVGEGIRVRFSLTGPTGIYKARLSLLIYTLAGERLAHAGRDVELAFGESGEAGVALVLAPLILGAGQYAVSALLEDASCVRFSEEARYDLWSQCAALSYEPTNESTPPLVHLTGWVTCGDREPVPARLAGDV